MTFKYTLEDLKMLRDGQNKEGRHFEFELSSEAITCLLEDAIKAREMVEKARVLAHSIKQRELEENETTRLQELNWNTDMGR